MVSTVMKYKYTAKTLDRVRDRIRIRHYSLRTETQYVQWIKRFILFHGKRHARNGCWVGGGIFNPSGSDW